MYPYYLIFPVFCGAFRFFQSEWLHGYDDTWCSVTLTSSEDLSSLDNFLSSGPPVMWSTGSCPLAWGLHAHSEKVDISQPAVVLSLSQLCSALAGLSGQCTSCPVSVSNQPHLHPPLPPVSSPLLGSPTTVLHPGGMVMAPQPGYSKMGAELEMMNRLAAIWALTAWLREQQSVAKHTVTLLQWPKLRNHCENPGVSMAPCWGVISQQARWVGVCVRVDALTP